MSGDRRRVDHHRAAIMRRLGARLPEVHVQPNATPADREAFEIALREVRAELAQRADRLGERSAFFAAGAPS